MVDIHGLNTKKEQSSTLQKGLVMSFVLITGGSKGIGLNMIHTFKKNNYKVIACSRRLNEDIKIADLYFSCDISKKEQVSKMFREIEKKDIRIQCLINNAGIAGQDTKIGRAHV